MQVWETLMEPINQPRVYLITTDSYSIQPGRKLDRELITHPIRSGGWWESWTVICVNHPRVPAPLGVRLQKIRRPPQEGTRNRMRKKWSAEGCCAEYYTPAGASFLQSYGNKWTSVNKIMKKHCVWTKFRHAAGIQISPLSSTFPEDFISSSFVILFRKESTGISQGL